MLEMRKGERARTMKKAHGIGEVIGKWHVVKLRDRSGMLVDVLSDSRITMEIRNDGNVSGKAGCNGYFCSIEIHDGKATVSPLGATRMYCPEPGIMDQETFFMMDLEVSKSLLYAEKVLELFNVADELMISLERDGSV
jgi:heat shock protein HslJ